MAAARPTREGLGVQVGREGGWATRKPCRPHHCTDTAVLQRHLSDGSWQQLEANCDMLIVSEQDTPPASAFLIALFNTIFNSLNTLFSVWDVTSSGRYLKEIPTRVNHTLAACFLLLGTSIMGLTHSGEHPMPIPLRDGHGVFLRAPFSFMISLLEAAQFWIDTLQTESELHISHLDMISNHFIVW